MGGMSQIVRDAARLFAGFILTFGIYIVTYGHLKPGGGFSGGIIIAGGFVLLVLAYGRIEGAFGLEEASHLFEPLGALLFLLVACLGLGGLMFFKNYGFPGAAPGRPTLLAGGTVLLSNLAIGLKVWMGIVAVFLGLAVFRRSRTGGAE
ncbi:MAG: MnhB domain-containing protein [Planctomycetota bacterium]|jgi:multicomponent Na+:H+ antiporter subunit B